MCYGARHRFLRASLALWMLCPIPPPGLEAPNTTQSGMPASRAPTGFGPCGAETLQPILRFAFGPPVSRFPCPVRNLWVTIADHFLFRQQGPVFTARLPGPPQHFSAAVFGTFRATAPQFAAKMLRQASTSKGPGSPGTPAGACPPHQGEGDVQDWV